MQTTKYAARRFMENFVIFGKDWVDMGPLIHEQDRFIQGKCNPQFKGQSVARRVTFASIYPKNISHSRT